MLKPIKSIEIFPQLKGKYDAIERFPDELTELVKSYIHTGKTTIRIYEDQSFMDKVWKVCDRYNIRCQRYVC